jgi:ABC-2 type transport system permease protein
MRVFRLYFRLLGLHLRALIEYRSDFLIMATAVIFMQVVNVVFLSAIFARVPTLNGWSLWAVVAMFALVAITEGVGSLFFEGTWHLSTAINEGSLDYILIRPYPIVLQVTSAEVGVNGLTNIVVGGIMLVTAITHLDAHWSIVRVLFGILLLVSAIAIKVSVNLATTSVAFWQSSPNPLFAMAIHQVGDLARFPLSIYPLALKAVLGFGIPFAFISSFPLSFLLDNGSTPWLGLLTPLVAVYCIGVALLIFSRGLRRYEGAGN